LDFAIVNKKGKSIFVEAKYTEKGFGECSKCDGNRNPVNNPNCCYLTTQAKRTYWEKMEKYELDAVYKNCITCPFTKYYQFYRELMFALELNGYFVILFDERNPALDNVIPSLIASVPENIKNNIKTLYIQEVLNILDNHQYQWTDKFRTKYGI